MRITAISGTNGYKWNKREGNGDSLNCAIFQRSGREVVNLLAPPPGSNRLEVFGTGEFFLPVVKRPKALRLQLERRSHMKSVESPNAQL